MQHNTVSQKLDMTTKTCWQEFYDDNLANMLLVRRDAAELQKTLNFICEQTKIAPGVTVFDQCCGIGSLSLPLAARGYHVTAIDQSERYIKRAKKTRNTQQVDFIAADARAFICDRKCDAAINWWTSFGHAENDSGNLQMLARAYDSLLPGGKYIVDYLHLPGVLRSFQPHVITRRQGADGKHILIRESVINLEKGIMEKLWLYILPDGTRVQHASQLRLYMPQQLSSMLLQAGFANVELFGSIDGERIHLDSQRCIAVAQKAVK